MKKLGTIWTAKAKIRFIKQEYDDMKWVTIAECTDTPNAIEKELKSAKEKYPNETLWVFSETRGKYIP